MCVLISSGRRTIPTCSSLANMPCFMFREVVAAARPYGRTNFTELEIQVISFLTGAADHVHVIERYPNDTAQRTGPSGMPPNRPSASSCLPHRSCTRNSANPATSYLSTGRKIHAAVIKNLVAVRICHGQGRIEHRALSSGGRSPETGRGIT